MTPETPSREEAEREEALAEKLRVNEGRRWPDWRTVPEGEPIEHEEGEG